MAYTLAKAAIAVGRDRSSILRAIKSGKISATRDEASGAWLIEAGELHRLYPPAVAQSAAQSDAEARTGDTAAEIRELRALLEQERQERQRERADKDDVIADLRQQRDRLLSLHEADQRLLADLREKPGKRRRLWPFSKG
ncbi:MAG TPA: hypothetical protein VFA12_13180 [Stellaceae bacterium]|nr:hypothetical protein [Stellaceae bacterium]